MGTSDPGSRAGPSPEGDGSRCSGKPSLPCPRASPLAAPASHAAGSCVFRPGGWRCPLTRCQAPRPTQDKFASSFPPLLSPSLAPLAPCPGARAIRDGAGARAPAAPSTLQNAYRAETRKLAGTPLLVEGARVWPHLTGDCCSLTGWKGPARRQVPSMPGPGEGHIPPRSAFHGFAWSGRRNGCPRALGCYVVGVMFLDSGRSSRALGHGAMDFLQ